MAGLKQDATFKLLESYLRLQQYVVQDFNQSLDRCDLYFKKINQKLENMNQDLPQANLDLTINQSLQKKILKVIKFNNQVRSSLEELNKSFKKNFDQFIQDLNFQKYMKANNTDLQIPHNLAESSVNLRLKYEQLERRFNSAATIIQDLTSNITDFIDNLKPSLAPEPKIRYNP